MVTVEELPGREHGLSANPPVGRGGGKRAGGAQSGREIPRPQAAPRLPARGAPPALFGVRPD